MTQPAAKGKILNFIQDNLITHFSDWQTTLTQGDFRQVEQLIFEQIQGLFDHVMTLLAKSSAKQMHASQKKDGSNLVVRTQKVQLRSGTTIRVDGLYRKRVPEGYEGSRHVLEGHWGLINGASPGYYDVSCHASVIGPSYDQAQCLLARHSVESSISGVRRLTNAVAAQCAIRGEVDLILEANETLAGKRVLISTDGGRSRVREYNGLFGDNGWARFNTPYREPKLFVIEVLDEHGRLCTHHLPIYGCRFGKEDHLELLREYLKQLNIDQAAEVQMVADGAAWIWNDVPGLLKELNVPADRITLTLDYYHAAQHLNILIQCLPKRVGKKQQNRIVGRCKEWLWQGKADHIVRFFQRISKRISKAARTEMNYFTAHRNHTQYADYERANLVCGSGVIESAIRRVVNLRFKNNSTFWCPENLEKLYFLRGAALSKRWDRLIESLANGPKFVGQS
jgi:hypothetical protein